MTDAEELAAIFGDLEFTVPVQCLRTGTVARGFLDKDVEILSGDVSMAGASNVLHVLHDALPGLVVDDRIRVGQIGAAAVAITDPVYLNRGAVARTDDGAFDNIALAKVV